MKKIISGFLVFLFVISSIINLNFSAASANDSNQKRVIGYFVEWGVYERDYHVADIPVNQLTHINYAFAKINEETSKIEIFDNYAATQKFYSETDSWSDPEGTLRGSFNQLRVLKKKNPHIKILISIGGWTLSKPFYSIAADAQKRKVFADSAVEFLQKYPFFDGVDVDWEFPIHGGLNPHLANQADRKNSVLLFQDLRDALDKANPDYLLTMALSANPAGLEIGYDEQGRRTDLDIEAIYPLMDWMNIMSYDYHGAWEAGSGTTGHNSPLYDSEISPNNSKLNTDWSVNALLNRGVPSNKIVPGLGFYGRSAEGVVSSENGGLYSSFTKAGPGSYEDGVLDYKDIANHYVTNAGFVRYWDSLAQVPYLFNRDKQIFISYDDAESIKNKAAYVANSNLGGVMFWELTGDNGDLVDAIHEGFGSNPLPQPPAPEPQPEPEPPSVPEPPAPSPEPEPTPEPPVPSPEPQPTPEPPSSPKVEGIVAELDSQSWGNSFCANATVTNTKSYSIDWYSLADLGKGTTISSVWSANHSFVNLEGKNKISFEGLSWNNILAPGASTTFGFCGNLANEAPTVPEPQPEEPPVEPAPISQPEEPETPDKGYTYTVTSDWGTGYCAKVVVENTTAGPLNWVVTLDIEGSISSLWSAEYIEAQASQIIVTGLSWNTPLSVGASTEFGFCANR